MRHFTALITRTSNPASFEAFCMDLPLPVITGRSLAEVQDNLLTAMQRHIDLTCELASAAEAPLHTGSRVSAQQRTLATSVENARRSGQALLLEIPEYLLTRN